jgi:predicted N-acetyltransferase YhbS
MGDILTRKTKIGSKKMKIREALETDFDDVLLIERLAFGYDKEANLVRELLHDLVQNRYYLCLL